MLQAISRLVAAWGRLCRAKVLLQPQGTVAIGAQDGGNVWVGCELRHGCELSASCWREVNTVVTLLSQVWMALRAMGEHQQRFCSACIRTRGYSSLLAPRAHVQRALLLAAPFASRGLRSTAQHRFSDFTLRAVACFDRELLETRKLQERAPSLRVLGFRLALLREGQ